MGNVQYHTSLALYYCCWCVIISYMGDQQNLDDQSYSGVYGKKKSMVDN